MCRAIRNCLRLTPLPRFSSLKTNVLSKILIPRIAASIRYILTELEEMEREEIFRLKRVKQNKLKNLEHVEEVGAGENTTHIVKPSEMKVKNSVGKTAEGLPEIAPPTADGEDPLLVIKAPESGEIGDAFKLTQQLQTIKPVKKIEEKNVEMKQDLQETVEETAQSAGLMTTPKTSKLLLSPDVLSLVPKTEEPEATLASNSKYSFSEAAALRDGSSVETELPNHNTPDTLSEEKNKNNSTESQGSSKDSLSVAGQLHKEQLDNTVNKSKKVSIETSNQPDISESFEEKELAIILPNKSDEIEEISKASLEKITLSVEKPNDTSLEIKPILLDENMKDSEKRIPKEIAEKINATGIDEKAPSKISSTISKSETTKLLNAIIPSDIISDNDLNQGNNTQVVADSAISNDKRKEAFIESSPEVSKNEVTKSKSSVRIKLPEDKNYEESQSDRKPQSILTDKNRESKKTKEVKESVQTHEKMTEGSVEKLGEGDNQMYTGQDQNVPDKIQIEHDGSVEGIVDAEPYFETSSVSKPSVSGLEGGVAGKSAAESEWRKDDYYEADIELDETDVEISTSRVANSTERRRDRSIEVDGTEPEGETDESRNESDVDGRAKQSKRPDDKNQQT